MNLNFFLKKAPVGPKSSGEAMHKNLVGVGRLGQGINGTALSRTAIHVQVEISKRNTVVSSPRHEKEKRVAFKMVSGVKYDSCPNQQPETAHLEKRK